MKLKREKLVDLMQIYCRGNYYQFARELNVDPSHIYRFIKTGVGGGSKIIGSIMKFCKKNKLDFDEYIEL
jgi:hypothetical protein